MDRSITTKRLYATGQYQNITIEDTISDVPEEFALDRKFMNLLRALQLVEMEFTYNKYIKLMEKTKSLPIDEALSELETIKINTLDDIKTYLQGEKTDD
jgi:hypothetical protein